MQSVRIANGYIRMKGQTFPCSCSGDKVKFRGMPVTEKSSCNFPVKISPYRRRIGKDDKKVVLIGLICKISRPIRRDKGNIVCIRLLDDAITPDITDAAFGNTCLNAQSALIHRHRIGPSPRNRCSQLCNQAPDSK